MNDILKKPQSNLLWQYCHHLRTGSQSIDHAFKQRQWIIDLNATGLHHMFLILQDVMV